MPLRAAELITVLRRNSNPRSDEDYNKLIRYLRDYDSSMEDYSSLTYAQLIKLLFDIDHHLHHMPPTLIRIQLHIQIQATFFQLQTIQSTHKTAFEPSLQLELKGNAIILSGLTAHLSMTEIHLHLDKDTARAHLSLASNLITCYQKKMRAEEEYQAYFLFSAKFLYLYSQLNTHTAGKALSYLTTAANNLDEFTDKSHPAFLEMKATLEVKILAIIKSLKPRLEKAFASMKKAGADKENQSALPLRKRK
jgi:hypothetical protein